MPVRVGIIGLGFMGKTHFDLHMANRKAKVVAVADPDPKRRAGDWSDLAGNIGDDGGTAEIEGLGIAAYDTPAKLIADPDVDLVDICLPTFMHADQAVAALKAGKHVICEKPMAIDSDGARAMIRAARRSRTLLGIGQCIRFWPAYEYLRKIIESGRYGAVTSAMFTRLSPTPDWAWKSWLTKKGRSGGAAMDLHLHDTDFVNHLFGKPRAVSSSGVIGPSGGIDHIVTNYDYGRKMQVTAEGGWIPSPTFPFEMGYRVVLEKATITYSCNADPALVVHSATGKVLTPKVPEGTGWEREIDYYLRCVQKGEAPERCTPESAAMSLRIVLAEIDSARHGSIVRVGR